MIPRVKICGITCREDALQCVKAGADALGFNFYKKSPRCIEPSKASKIIAELPAYIVPVGIFVNERRSTIEDVIKKTGIRIIQLSGDEQPEDCEAFDVKVWKAFRFTLRREISAAQRYHLSAAMLDGTRGDVYGGSGVTADFSIAIAMKEFHPLILAGGLNPENIIDAIKTVQPFAVDVNSGIESSPGKKDPNKLQLLFKQLAQLQ